MTSVQAFPFTLFVLAGAAGRQSSVAWAQESPVLGLNSSFLH